MPPAKVHSEMWFVLGLLNLISTGYGSSIRPNIIFILADDMGWNDVGFTGRSDLQTPNIDALAYNGRILSQHYALPTCTPSRSALLTGKYPIRTGMQGYPLAPSEPRALPLEHRLLPQHLKKLGYSTHLVGKWHLGYHQWKYTPTARGFDSHFGYLNGFIGYYDHKMNVQNQSGHDFWRNKKPQYELQGQYVTDLLTKESVRLINEAAQGKTPLFLFLSQLAPHAGNPGNYHEYPEEDLARFKYITDIQRRKYAAMVWNLDKSVGQVVKALADTKLLDNTIIALISDNGAQTIGLYPNDGSNYPMRGLKFTLFEGGLRTAAAMWSPKISRGVYREMFHISDWLPTLYEAAGGDLRELSGLDGRSQWSSLQGEDKAVRTEMLLNIDEKTEQRAVRHHNWKLLSGTYIKGAYDNYFGDYTNTNFVYNLADVNKSAVSNAFRSRDITTVSKSEALDMRMTTTITCEPNLEGPQFPKNVPCSPGESACLFDLQIDPCEHSNIAIARPDILALLQAKLETYESMLTPQLNTDRDPMSNPKFFNDTWTPWLEKDDIFIQDIFNHLTNSANNLWNNFLTVFVVTILTKIFS